VQDVDPVHARRHHDEHHEVGQGGAHPGQDLVGAGVLQHHVAMHLQVDAQVARIVHQENTPSLLHHCSSSSGRLRVGAGAPGPASGTRGAIHPMHSAHIVRPVTLHYDTGPQLCASARWHTDSPAQPACCPMTRCAPPPPPGSGACSTRVLEGRFTVHADHGILCHHAREVHRRRARPDVEAHRGARQASDARGGS
jgi:hypothetical protein